MSVKKNPEEVELMRRGAKLLSECLDMLVTAAWPGVSGKQIDTLAEEFIRDHGAVPAFKGYGAGANTFPATICFSRNSVLVHGVPTEQDIIQDGDVITIDCGLSIDGWFADAARLFGVGGIDPVDESMIYHNHQALEAGINACLPGKKLGYVCRSIQNSIVASPFFNVVQFCGHGIGRAMHEEPQVPNYGKPNEGITLEPGMIFCIEPMLLKYRKTKVGVLRDGWTVVTTDGSKSTHVEHMVLVTEGQPEVLTKSIIA